jgi:hypothetical protein
MPHRWFHRALAGFLIACALPFLAISSVMAGVSSLIAKRIPVLRHRPIRCYDPQRAWDADEFGFENAIERYEAVIDAHARRAQ